MTDLPAIRERHQPKSLTTGERCGFCGLPWPCDTAQALARVQVKDRAVTITAIRERHRLIRYGVSRQCIEDDQPWPCDVAVLIAALDAQPVGLDAKMLAEAIRLWYVEVSDERPVASWVAKRYAALASEPQPEPCPDCDGHGERSGWPHGTCPTCHGSGLASEPQP